MDVIEVAPRLHWLRFAVGHAYVWRDDDGVTLIDTGVPGSAPAIEAALQELGHATGDVRRLFLTHWHEDHVGAAAQVAQWADVTVYAHHADAPVIRGTAQGAPPDLLDWERDLLAQVRTGMPADPPAPVRVDRELAGGEVLDIGGGAQVLAVPGHTPGSAALYLPGPGVLFTGDTIARTPDGEVILGVFNVDRAGAAASFRVQAALDVDIACFGHGDPLVGDAAAVLRAAAP
jgi:glyoxylase-like metal-dependent hydrolase (beta-lactamase superfamily II)